MNWVKEERQKAVVIHEEKAAECIRCHKPFAPQSMIDMLQNKLRGHSHFSDEAAINRIVISRSSSIASVLWFFVKARMPLGIFLLTWNEYPDQS